MITFTRSSMVYNPTKGEMERELQDWDGVCDTLAQAWHYEWDVAFVEPLHKPAVWLDLPPAPEDLSSASSITSAVMWQHDMILLHGGWSLSHEFVRVLKDGEWKSVKRYNYRLHPTSELAKTALISIIAVDIGLGFELTIAVGSFKEFEQ